MEMENTLLVANNSSVLKKKYIYIKKPDIHIIEGVFIEKIAI